jgi:4-amino-4-deoxy-L-arabinose transferase-like glycosyltransferase
MKKSWKRWRTACIFLLLILSVGLILRIYNLIHLPIFADEAIYIRWAQIMQVESTLRFVPLSDGKQPLFMWAVIPFLKVFSDPLFAGRLVSAICGIITIIGIFVASKILFKSEKTALLGSLIYAAIPFSVFFDRMALVDSMLAMFGIWVFILATLTFRTKKTDIAMLTGFTLGGALLTKSPSLFFSLFLPFTWILTNWPKSKTERLKQILHFISLSIIIFMIGYIMYNILRLGPNFHMLRLRNLDYVYPLRHLLDSPMNPFGGHISGILDYFVKLGSIAFILLFLFGSINGVKNYKKPTLVLLIWGLIPIFVNAEYAKVLTARYILFCLPFLVIVAAESLLTEGLAKKIVLMIFAVFMIQSLLQDRLLLTNVQAANLPQGDRSGYLEEWTSGYGIKETSEYLKTARSMDPGKQFVVGTEGGFGTLPDGLQIYLNDIPDIIVIGLGIGFTEVPSSLTESKEAGNRTFMVINSTRLIINDPESRGLQLIAAYPKALRKVGSREYNLHGPRETLLLFELK